MLVEPFIKPLSKKREQWHVHQAKEAISLKMKTGFTTLGLSIDFLPVSHGKRYLIGRMNDFLFEGSDKLFLGDFH